MHKDDGVDKDTRLNARLYRMPTTLILTPLVPSVEDVESLFGNLQVRPVLMLEYPFRDKMALQLGRNSTTQITDLNVSRNLCSIRYLIQNRDVTHPSFDQMTMACPELLVNEKTIQHDVMLNGEKVTNDRHELQSGDVISLLGSKYKYRVDVIRDTSVEQGDKLMIENNETNLGISTKCGNSTSQCNTINNKISQIQPEIDDKIQAICNKAKTSLMENATCPVCLEILVDSTVIHPCGHIFCGLCVKKFVPNLSHQKGRKRVLTNCPTCRVDIMSSTKIRIYDDVIWNMFLSGDVLVGNDVQQEDMRSFLRRCGKGINSLNESERQCILENVTKKRQKLAKETPLRSSLRSNDVTNSVINLSVDGNLVDLSSPTECQVIGGSSASDAICLE